MKTTRSLTWFLASVPIALSLIPATSMAQITYTHVFNALETQENVRAYTMDPTELKSFLDDGSTNGSNFTIAFWFQVTAEPSGIADIMKMRRTGIISNDFAEILLRATPGSSSSEITLTLGTNLAGTTENADLKDGGGSGNTILIQPGDWHYFLLEVDTSNNNITAYLDGELAASQVRDLFPFHGTNTEELELGEGISSAIHSMSIWSEISSQIRTFHDDVIRYGPPAFGNLADGDVPNASTLVGWLEYYMPFAGSLEAVSPGNTTSLPLWSAIDPTVSPSTTIGSAFRSVSQIFERISRDVTVTASPLVAGTAGGSLLSPAPGTIPFGEGEVVSFKAPEFIYLDRDGNTLSPLPGEEVPPSDIIENYAVARWKTLGYTVAGSSISGTDRAVDIVLEDNLTFEWQFQKEVAVIVDSALPVGLGSLGSGNPNPAVQKHWVPEGTSQIAQIDGAVIAPDSANDIRFRIRGYELQNHPDGPTLGVGSFLRQSSVGTTSGNLNLSTSNGGTISYWLRVNPEQKINQTIATIGDTEIRIGGLRNAIFRLQGSVVLRPDEQERRTDRWNHWCITYDPASGSGVSAYLNGRLVAQKPASSFSLNGNLRFVVNPARCDLDNVRLWERPLTSTEILEAMHEPVLEGHPTLDPAAEFTFDDAPTATGNGTETEYRISNDVFAQWNDVPSRLDSDRFFVPVTYDDPQQVPEFILNDFAVVRWHWQKEYKIENLTVNGLFDTALTTTSGDSGSLASAGVLWVKEGDEVTVTALQSTGGSAANAFLGLPTGMFENILFSTSGINVDNSPTGLTSTVSAGMFQLTGTASRPGRIIWNYGEPIYTVEVPLGTGFRPDDTIGIDPVVNTGGLDLSQAAVAPYEVTLLTGDNPSDATVNNVARWDSVQRWLFPVRPGQFLTSWPTDNGSGNRLVRIIAGFPGDSYTFDDGTTRTFASDFLLENGFPGYPHAHYNALYNAEVGTIETNANPPIILDVDPSDRWHFSHSEGLAYSEQFTRDPSTGEAENRSLASTAVTLARELEIREKSRSVLVFSARPNKIEFATGDLLREQLEIRIVESIPLDAATRPQSELFSGEGDVGDFDGSTNLPLSNAPFLSNGDFTIDFWARWLPTGPDPNQTIFRAGSGAAGSDILFINFGPSTSPPDGNSTLNVVALGPGAQGQKFAAAPGELTDRRWHHWTATYVDDGSNRTFSIYRDGVLASKETFPYAQFPNLQLSSSTSIGGNDIPALGLSRFEGQLDNFRIWTTALSPEDIAHLPFTASPTPTPEINFTFDTPATGTTLSQDGTSTTVTGTVMGTAAAAPNSLFLVPGIDGHTEVATKVESRFDSAEFGTGFIVNEISNHNARLYDRTAQTGEWGPIYPVNSSSALGEGTSAPVTVWYGNLHSLEFLSHPNVDWPLVALEYDAIRFPQSGPHKDNRIYIASRIGSEGVDATGNPQQVFESNRYVGLNVYNQPDRDATGYNPNEEHALIAGSVRHLIGGATPTNDPPDAFFALRDDLNLTGPDYTSEPWVLGEFTDVQTGEMGMSAWKVEKTRNAAVNQTLNIERRTELYPTLNYDKSDFGSFLQPATTQPANPTYDFHYAVFAGDPLGFPYPLGNVIGAVAPPENTVTALDSRRVFWKDHKGNPWIVSGREPSTSTAPNYEARFDGQFWYPLQPSFWYDLDNDGSDDLPSGTSIRWLPDSVGVPQLVRHESFWKNDYPVLKTGETLTFAGGEYKADRPASAGLPGIVGWAASQVIFDTANPEMADIEQSLSAQDDITSEKYSARIVRPLDELSVEISLDDFPSGLSPANQNVLARGTRWFFTDLPASLQQRVYYDFIEEKLVLRGLLNDRDIGDPDLTQDPISLYVLDPNILNESERLAIQNLDDLASTPSGTWDSDVLNLYNASRNPASLDLAGGSGTDTPATVTDLYYPGLMPVITRDSAGNFTYNTDPETGIRSLVTDNTKAEPLMSLGAGSALITAPRLLNATAADFAEPLYVTLAENNHPSLGAAPVSVHVVRISPQRFRGGVKVIEPQNPFDEKVTLRHTADFGGAIEDVRYEWYAIEVDGEIPRTTPEIDTTLWGAPMTDVTTVNFELAGLPERLLADQWIFARYKGKDEFNYRSGSVPLLGAGSEETNWIKGTAGDPAPYQWAGAANSPQVQSGGNLAYVPALAIGWVKRVLDRINPYEARINDFYNNESPATYTSMIQQAGARPRGPVALNPDKNVVENVGLIALYQTVLDRAYDLANATLADTNGVQQALLLAATRISDFYMLLGNEAYSDALDPMIGVGTGSVEFGSFAPTVWSFQNEESSLLHEELALLRGSDFAKAWPVDNRLFWNFLKGQGEAVYVSNYNISDSNLDGFINEFDAAEQYPQGHGDAWGHYLSSLKTHYDLLRSPFFRWLTRAEFYSLADNVLEVDYLDEVKFARTAAARARAGSAIVQQTYRAAYTADPDGQWQGYTDVDVNRAWGVKGWGKRAGQGAYFDWVASNALLPENAPDRSSGLPAENLENIDRTSVAAPGVLATALVEIQGVLDDATLGVTPVGIGEDTVPFDIDPARIDRGSAVSATHFEQIHERAVTALNNAVAAFDHASGAGKRLRQVANSTQEFAEQAFDQDLAYRNRLKQLFGSPYEGTIGSGRLYPPAYDGPDLFLWLYVDANSYTDYFPAESPVFIDIVNEEHEDVTDVPYLYEGLYGMEQAQNTLAGFFSTYLARTFSDFEGYAPGRLVTGPDGFESTDELLTGSVFATGSDFETLFNDFDLPLYVDRNYGLQAPDEWGSRRVTGRIQSQLNKVIQAQIDVFKSVDDYQAYLRELKTDIEILLDKQETLLENTIASDELLIAKSAVETGFLIADGLKAVADLANNADDDIAITAEVSIPDVVGTSNDVAAPAQGFVFALKAATSAALDATASAIEIGKSAAEYAFNIVDGNYEIYDDVLDQRNDFVASSQALAEAFNGESTLRLAIASALNRQVQEEQEFSRLVEEATALLEERESANTALAANVQRERYNDMTLRIVRNDAMQKYRDAFELAARYAYLAAQAYAFETNLSDGHPANARGILTEIVAARLPGHVAGGQPQINGGGLAESLAKLKANYDVLNGQLGFNNPQTETGKFSLRRELFRVKKPVLGDTSPEALSSEERWRQTLGGRFVPNLWSVPEFRNYCRAPWTEDEGAQPGLVIPFGSEIFEGSNFFGWPLGGGDQSYDPSLFSTKIRSVGVWLEGYDGQNLAVAPRVWLVPAGNDIMRISNGNNLETRAWSVIDQALPAPFVINPGDLNDNNFIPGLSDIVEPFGSIRRFSRFRAYHDDGEEIAGIDNDEMSWNSRLVGRSVWNTKWLLIIPGSTLSADPDSGLRTLIGTSTSPGIRDIRLLFKTYSASGN